MKIQRADPAARRRAVVIAVAVFAVLTGLMIFVRQSGMEELANQISDKPVLLPIAGLLMVAPICLFALYTLRQGRRVVRARRFPVPGDEVIRDTLIREGQSAVRVGRLMQWLSVMLAAFCLGIPWLLWRLADTIAYP